MSKGGVVDYANAGHEEVRDDENSYTVAMKGAPNMAQVTFARNEREALIKTARYWHCEPEQCYIYRGRDE